MFEDKWLALALIAVGCTLLFASYRADKTADFESRSFIGVVIGIVAGVVCIAGGLGIFLVAGFKAI
jgi:hypothetical protein